MTTRSLARRFAAAPLVALLAVPALAGAPPGSPLPAPAPTPLAFARGASSAPLTVRLAPAEVVRVTVTARAGQWLELTGLPSDEDAPAHLHMPGWKMSADGSIDDTTELPLPRYADATKSGALLEEDGGYLIEIGPATRRVDGTVTVAIRAPRGEDCEDLPQQPMNRCFAAVAAEAEAGRARVYAKLEGPLETKDRDLLAQSERAWKAYAEATCRFAAAGFEGGTLQPTIYWGCVARVTNDRAKELEWLRGDREPQ